MAKKSKQSNQRRQPKPAPIAPQPTTPENAEVQASPWLEKWQQNKLSWSLIGGVTIIILAIMSIYAATLKARSEESWQTLQNVWNTMVMEQSLEKDLLVRDLGPDLANLVKTTLGSMDFLPKILTQDQEGKASDKTLDEFEVRKLPNPLRDTVLRQYNINQLQEKFASAGRTSAGPWLAYTLAQLHFANHEPQEALKYYEMLKSKYNQSVLTHNLLDVQEQTVVENEIQWMKSQQVGKSSPFAKVGSKTNVVFTTSKGKFTMQFLQGQFPKNMEKFLDLVNQGLFNGINFYKSDENLLYSGCSLGTGKGNPDWVTELELKDLIIQRGLVAFVTTEKDATKGDTRFYIFKKYPWLEANKRHAFIGQITSGMEVVDSLTTTDVLLDVSVVSNL